MSHTLLALALTLLFQVAQGSDDPFARLVDHVKARNGSWDADSSSAAAVFHECLVSIAPAERRAALLRFVGSDLERHFWAASYLVDPLLTHGATPDADLAMLILSQAISTAPPDGRESSELFKIRVKLAVVAEECGFRLLASECKAAADRAVANDKVHLSDLSSLPEPLRKSFARIPPPPAATPRRQAWSPGPGWFGQGTYRFPEGQTPPERAPLFIVLDPPGDPGPGKEDLSGASFAIWPSGQFARSTTFPSAGTASHTGVVEGESMARLVRAISRALDAHAGPTQRMPDDHVYRVVSYLPEARGCLVTHRLPADLVASISALEPDFGMRVSPEQTAQLSRWGAADVVTLLPQDDTWIIAEAKRGSHRFALRIRDQPPRGFTPRSHPHLVEVSWTYDSPGNSGLPTGETTDSMSRFEDLLDKGIESAEVGALMSVITGGGSREYQWYCASHDQFMAALNKALAGHPAFPIEITLDEDPAWDTYRDMKSSLRKAP